MKEEKNRNREWKKEEYAFSGGIRSKHFKSYRKGHTVCIRKEDGTTSVHYFRPADEKSDIDFLAEMQPGRNLLDMGGFLMEPNSSWDVK
jgi:hypothetical protein